MSALQGDAFGGKHLVFAEGTLVFAIMFGLCGVVLRFVFWGLLEVFSELGLGAGELSRGRFLP